MTRHDLPTTGHNADDDPLAADLELRRELAALFLKHSPLQLDAIRAAVANRNGPALADAVHRLKGSAAIFREKSAFDAALRMEEIASDPNWPAAEAAWQVLNREMTQLWDTLSRFVALASGIQNDDA